MFFSPFANVGLEGALHKYLLNFCVISRLRVTAVWVVRVRVWDKVGQTIVFPPPRIGPRGRFCG
jgi:hypothetical protein